MVPLFDKVLVINSGRCIYYGPIRSAVDYFEGLGFACPPNMSVTDFLNSMSANPEARHLREGTEPWKVPQTPDEFAQSFKQSAIGKETALMLNTASSDEDSHKAGTKQTTTRRKYPVPIWMQILLCAYRQYRIFITDYNSWIIEAVCLIVQSVILGTVFRNLPHSTQSLYQLGSVVFYVVLIPSLQSMSEFGNTFAQRPLLLKHKNYRFYHPLSYGYGQIMTDVVWKVVAIAYNIPMYFLTNMQRKADRFFIFFLVAYISHLTLSMFFRFIAVLSPNVEKAGLPVGTFLTALVIYTGWYIPPPQMQIWLAWFRYLNVSQFPAFYSAQQRLTDTQPMYYAFESLMINEIGTQQYACSPSDIIPQGPNYNNITNQACAIQGSEPGNNFVEGSAYLRVLYGFDNSHMWRNVGINAGLFVVFAVLVG